MTKTKESSCCEGKEGATHCWVRVLLIFLLGILVGGVTVGLMYFYEVLPPDTFGASTFRDYSRPPVTPVETQSFGPGTGGLIDLQSFGPGTGGLVDPRAFGPGTGGLVR